jgi:hypothetical protein
MTRVLRQPRLDRLRLSVELARVSDHCERPESPVQLFQEGDHILDNSAKRFQTRFRTSSKKHWNPGCKRTGTSRRLGRSVRRFEKGKLKLAAAVLEMVGLHEREAVAVEHEPDVDEEYPKSGDQLLPQGVTREWARFSQGNFDRTSQDGKLWEWFETYEDDALGSLDVYEEYVSIPNMRSLVVLVTADPNDVNGPDDDDESDEEEEYTPSWKR